jgi:hypothetical protein
MHCPGATHAPLEHDSFAGHTRPHLPQLLESELRLVQTAAPVAEFAQLVWPIAHWPGGRHVPLEQVSDAGQTLPHAPQLFESVLRVVQTTLPIVFVHDV